MIHLILDFLILLPLTGAIRITVKECPVNKTAWQSRAQVFECVTPEVYHCIQDDLGTLMETCMTPELINPSSKREYGCPWVLHTSDGSTIIAFIFHPCNGLGCPKRDDPEYWSNQLYKYPICLHHYAKSTILTTGYTTSTPLELSITDTTPGYYEKPPERKEKKDAVPIILGVLTGLVGVAVVIIVAVWWYRYTSRRLPAVDTSEETLRFLQLAKIKSTTESHQQCIPQRELQCLQDSLVENYGNATQCIPVIPLGKITMLLSQLFSPVVVVEGIKSKEIIGKEMQPERKSIEKTDEMFFNDAGKPIKRIFMKGEAGRGKTVYGLKLSEEWCKVKQGKQSDMQDVLSQFEFIFHVSMRHVKTDRTKVLDMICDSLSEDDPYLVDLITLVLCNKDIRCLVVLDGLDEWSSDSDKLPNTNGLLNCVLFMTSRPWKLEKLQIDYTPQDKAVEIIGINPESDETLIPRIVTHLYGGDDEGFTNALINYCKQRAKYSKIKELMKIPMMLTASCYVWCEEKPTDSKTREEKRADKSLTYFSLAIIDMLIQRAEKNNKDVKDYLKKHYKEETEPKSTTHTLSSSSFLLQFFPKIIEFQDILTPFCKVAYNDLMSITTLLVFRKNNLEREMGKSTVELALKVGFISQCWAPGKGMNVQNISVNFFHKLIQELMAAMHIVCNPDLLQIFCHECDTIDKIRGLSNVIMYLTGLDSELGCQLSQHVGRIAETDQGILLWRETMRLEHEDKVWSLYRKQCEWYKEMAHMRTLMGINILPPFQISDVFLVPRYCESEAVRITGELMSATHHAVVSVFLWEVANIPSIVQCLPQHSTSLTALSIMRCDEQECESLATVITQLTQIQFLRYGGDTRDVDANVVGAITKLSRLKSIELWYINLGENTLSVSHMTQLASLRIFGVYMSARNWGKFLSHLRSIQHKVCVSVEYTDIDAESIAMIHSSPQFKLDTDSDKCNLKFYKET